MEELTFGAANEVAQLAGLPPLEKKGLTRCLGVSEQCVKDMEATELDLKLWKDYMEYFRKNAQCVRNDTAPCWDEKHNHWKSNICSVDCKLGEQELRRTCERLNGTICDWQLQIGLGGTSIKAVEPLCIPNSCNTDANLNALDNCILKNTCDQVSREVLPVCGSKFLCRTAFDLDRVIITGTVISMAGLTFLAFCISRVKVYLFSRKDPVEEVSYDLQHALLEDQDFRIVEGTPRQINDELLQQSSAVQATPDIYFDELEEDRSRNIGDGIQASIPSRPVRFKLNSDLESHVVETLKKSLLKGDKNGKLVAESSIVWHNLCFRRHKIDILNGLTGMAKPGMMIAVIGAPDSGATTFLKLLAGRAVGGKRWGDILIDGMPPDQYTHRKVSYIPKEDFNLPTLTVRETLAFSLAMRTDSSLSDKLRRERVDATLQLLGLSHVAETVVGDQLIRGCSGGEKRRVSIGVECIVGRRIQIMDCVTNGLDSAAAYEVMKTARVLADTKLNCSVSTIRQPSQELLGLFHKVMLLSRGSCIYFGPTSEVESYLAGLGFTRPLTKSLPDYLEELTYDASLFSVDGEESGSRGTFGEIYRSIEDSEHEGGKSLKRLQSHIRINLMDSFKLSAFYRDLGREIWEELDRAASSRRPKFAAEDDPLYDDPDGFTPWIYQRYLRIKNFFRKRVMNDDRYETRFRDQFRVCLGRQVKITLRSPTAKAKIFRAFFQGVLLGTMFFQLGLDQRDARNRFGFIFIVITSVTMGSLAIIPQLFNQRTIFYHQYAAGYFRSFAYLASLVMCEIPLFFLEAGIFLTITYPLCGLNGGVFSENWLYFVLSHVLLNFGSFSLCLLGVMGAPTATVATAAIPTIMSLMILFSGYLVQREKLPWAGVNDLSMVTRPFKGLALNEMEGLIFRCDDDELVPPVGYPNATIPPPNGFWGPEYRTCPLGTGRLSLHLYGLQNGEQNKWKLLSENIWFIVVFQGILMLIVNFVSYAPDSSDSAETSRRNRRKLERLEKKALIKRVTSQDDFQTANDRVSFDSEERNRPIQTGSVEFENLSYIVFLPKSRFCSTPKKLQLLHNISGHVKGRILALMGPSGSGKSTLLDVLAMRKTGGEVTFDKLLINGRPRDKFFPRIAGYVEQMDSHLPTTTVFEAVMISAELRLPSSISLAERKRRVDETLRNLDLDAFVDEKIGTPDDGGVSPEIRKKVTIAVELVFDSEVLFLDEPTTGLDGKSALNIMQAIRKTCAKKSTICTIHQPSAEVFALFDWMLLLQKGGRVCFFGSVEEMIPYFESSGFGKCGAEKNPADFALECANRTTPGQDPASIFASSDLREKVSALAPSLEQVSDDLDEQNGGPKFSKVYAATVFVQFKHQLRTQLAYQYRDTTLLFTRCFTAVLFGLIIGTVFFDMDRSQASAESRVGLIFIGLVYTGYTAILSIPKSIDQRPVRFREYGSNYYAMWVHYLAIFLAEIPFFTLQVSLYVGTFYPLVGLRNGYHFFYFLGVLLIHSLTAYGYSSLISMIAPNADTATIINTVSNGTMTLLCGFLLPFQSIPTFWRAVYYLSFYRFPLGALVSNEMLDASFNCGKFNNESALPVFVGGLDRETPPPPFGIGRPNAACFELIEKNFSIALQDTHCFRFFCPIIDGSFILERFSFPITWDKMNENLLYLAIFAICFRFLAFVALVTIQHIKR